MFDLKVNVCSYGLNIPIHKQYKQAESIIDIVQALCSYRDPDIPYETLLRQRNFINLLPETTSLKEITPLKIQLQVIKVKVKLEGLETEPTRFQRKVMLFFMREEMVTGGCTGRMFILISCQLFFYQQLFFIIMITRS